jgi:proteasome lid subunit RPN8/RPN11
VTETGQGAPEPGRLRLPAAVLAAMVQHAEQTHPEECCGILVGRDERQPAAEGPPASGVEGPAVSDRAKPPVREHGAVAAGAGPVAMQRAPRSPAAPCPASPHPALFSPAPCEPAPSLIGGRPHPRRTRVVRRLPAANQRRDRPTDRYALAPETLLAAQKQARADGLDLVGYYHSHPGSAAVPSAFDREHAWPGVSYLIVSVQGGRAEEARSWRLADDRESFDEEPLEHPEEHPEERPEESEQP